MTAQRIPNDSEHPDEAAPVEGRITVRITIGRETYTAECATKEEARAWLRRMAAQHSQAREKEATTR